MEVPADETAEANSPGFGVAAIALAGTSVPIAAALTVLMGFAPLYPFIFVVTLAIVLAIGLPVFRWVRRRPTWGWTLAGGFLTGAIVPALVLMLLPTADTASSGGVQTVVDGAYTWAGWLQNLMAIGGFGLIGVVGAVMARLLVRWLMTGGLAARIAPGAVITSGVAAIWLVPWAATDRSCHNTMRDGRTSISPVAEFRLRATMQEWPAVQDEIDRFARENGWDVRADVRPDPGFPWFQVSVCREPGTYIFVTTAAFEQDQMSISVYQPQGGNSWQAPLRKLQDRFERRWPGRVNYSYGEYSTPRPPWAPTSPPPADAPLRPNQKTL